jgi:hypothetical protein
MKLKLNFQPLGVAAQSARVYRRYGSMLAACLPWLTAGGVEEIEPLITPSIVPLQEIPESGSLSGAGLGFPGVPAEGTLPMEDGFNPLPGVPDGFAEAPFSAEGLMPSLAAADPSMIADTSALEDPLGLPDSEGSGSSSSGDFANSLGGLPPWQGGIPASPGLSNNWPRGFADFPGGMPYGGGLFDDIRDGLGLSASLSGTYDTNPSRGYGQANNAGEGDFFLSLGGTVSYLSRASTWTYGATYTGGYSQYFSQSELSGYYQNAGASLNYNGGPLTASLNVGINFGSGANRYYESVVDEISYNYGLNARYRVSRKTSLTGDLSQRFTSASGNGNSDTESLDLGASALWRYSPLLEFGPGIRYTSRSGDSSQERTSIGPTLTANYELTRKVSLNSRIGVDFAEFEDGESADPTLFTSIGLNYRASKLWSMNLSLLRDSEASYTAGGEFEEIMALRLGYNRKIRRAVWSLGMGWETRSTENSSAATNTRPDRDYLTLDTSLGMPVFRDTCNASVFMRYSDQSGDANQSWDSLQTGFSISRSF